MSNFKDITFEKQGPVAILSLNRPDALNALTLEMMAEAKQALDLVEKDKEIRALVFTGKGRAFCSGQDLKNRVPEGTDIVEEILKCYYPVFQALRNCRVPVINAVNGVAAGGGCSLALSGDIIIASEATKFIQVFSRIGLIPDLGSTYLLPRAIGRARALEMMLTNEPLPAKTALEWGLINRVSAPENLMQDALSFAQKLATGPTYALQMTRQIVDDGEEERFKDRFRKELQTNKIMRETHDSKEGVAAFLEKRTAEFRGE
jgi:2-(1,2-epoxy-1,2-dihydrophenyl)acetyl-CoA isomerase